MHLCHENLDTAVLDRAEYWVQEQISTQKDVQQKKSYISFLYPKLSLSS
jgi:hypothetical protein